MLRAGGCPGSGGSGGGDVDAAGRRQLALGALGAAEPPSARKGVDERGRREAGEDDPPAEGDRAEAGRAPEAVDALDEDGGPCVRSRDVEPEQRRVAVGEAPVLERRGVGDEDDAAPPE